MAEGRVKVTRTLKKRETGKKITKGNRQKENNKGID